MAHFVYDTNNGVTALITGDDYLRYQLAEKLESGIFLFSDSIDWPVHGQPWFHGDMTMMDTLLEGHSLERGSFGGVPFSSGATLYHTREDLFNEIVSIAPMHKLLEAFDVDLQRTVVTVQ